MRCNEVINPAQCVIIAVFGVTVMCTKEALIDVFDIIVVVNDHPTMQEFGEAMKRRLHSGKCAMC